MLKRIIKIILWRIGVFPYFYLLYSPFKIYEFKIMTSQIDNNNEATVLDLGCGDGTQAILNADKFRNIIGLDPNEGSVKLAKDKLLFKGKDGGVQFFAKTVEAMRFASSFFDGVVSYCVFEHIPNYEEVLNELYRILKPSGWLLLSIDSLSVINDPILLDKHRTEHHVVRYFRVKEMEDLLIKTGFENVRVEPILKSQFAKKLFEKGINNNFEFNKIIGLIYAWLLFTAEKFYRRNNEGLFLIAKAYKPRII